MLRFQHWRFDGFCLDSWSDVVTAFFDKTGDVPGYDEPSIIWCDCDDFEGGDDE